MRADDLEALLNGFTPEQVREIAAYAVKEFKVRGTTLGPVNTRALDRAISTMIHARHAAERARLVGKGERKAAA